MSKSGNLFSDNTKEFKALARYLNADFILDTYHLGNSIFKLLMHRANEKHPNSNKYAFQAFNKFYQMNVSQKAKHLWNKFKSIKIMWNFVKYLLWKGKTLIPISKRKQLKAFLINYDQISSCYVDKQTAWAESLVSKYKYQVLRYRKVYTLNSIEYISLFA